MNREANVTKRSKLPRSPLLPVVLSANGRIRPDWARINRREERHPEGAEYLEWREGTKRTLSLLGTTRPPRPSACACSSSIRFGHASVEVGMGCFH